MNIKGRLKVGKYFQTAFGLIGKNIFSEDRVRAFGHIQIEYLKRFVTVCLHVIRTWGKVNKIHFSENIS